MDPVIVEDWQDRLPSICEGYSSTDIFNADETACYYKALPTRGLVQKGDDPAGVKRNLTRISVLVAASAAGEKLKTTDHWEE